MLLFVKGKVFKRVYLLSEIFIYTVVTPGQMFFLNFFEFREMALLIVS